MKNERLFPSTPLYRLFAIALSLPARLDFNTVDPINTNGRESGDFPSAPISVD